MFTLFCTNFVHFECKERVNNTAVVTVCNICIGFFFNGLGGIKNILIQRNTNWTFKV